MSKPSRYDSEVAENSTPNWVLYALLTAASLLIAKTIDGALLVLAGSGIALMFAMFYLSKPVAEIQTVKEKDNSDQLNMFHKRHKIGKKYSSRQPGTSKPSSQRKRYLKKLKEEDRRAA